MKTPKRPDKAEDERWMALALAEGRKGLGLTRPNPAVGAVVVRNGKWIATGWHQAAGTPHAEIHALRSAGDRARGATLYVTLEPCSTYGRTPPCTEAIKTAGVARVVIGATDSNPRHVGAGMKILRRAGIECVSGILREEAEDLVAGFFHLITSGLPRVILKMGVTLDGRVADATGKSKWITGPESRECVQQMRREADAVMVGAGTVIADNPSLLPRPDGGRKTWRIIVDGAGRCPIRSRAFRDEAAPQTLVLTSPESSVEWRKAVSRKGTQVIVLGRSKTLRPMAILKYLGSVGISSVLCEGGGALAGNLLKAGVVDELHWFIAPRLLGADAVPVVNIQGWKMTSHPEFALRKVETLGADVHLILRPGPTAE